MPTTLTMTSLDITRLLSRQPPTKLLCQAQSLWGLLSAVLPIWNPSHWWKTRCCTLFSALPNAKLKSNKSAPEFGKWNSRHFQKVMLNLYLHARKRSMKWWRLHTLRRIVDRDVVFDSSVSCEGLVCRSCQKFTWLGCCSAGAVWKEWNVKFKAVTVPLLRSSVKITKTKREHKNETIKSLSRRTCLS